MKNILVFIVLSGLIFFACQSDSNAGLTPTSLLEYGVPITILAPDSVDVSVDDIGMIKDITVEGGDEFFIQIYASDAETTDIARIKAEQLDLVKASPFFSKIMEEDQNGFIFENVIDSTTTSYGFRHIRVQGDREFVFQNHLSRIFSLDQVTQMNKAVQPIKK